jgi:hypothetical protein
MSEGPYRTGTLWVVLLLLLMFGSLAAAGAVWALTDLVATGHYLVDLPVLAVTAFAAIVLFLLLVGILYRVDRLRGVPHRRVELFE